MKIKNQKDRMINNKRNNTHRIDSDDYSINHLGDSEY